MARAFTKEEVEKAASAIPGLSVDLSEFRPVVDADDVNLPDLLLSWASLKGDRAALAELTRRLSRVCGPVLSRFGDQSFAEDVTAEVMEKLLVGPKAKLRGYSGRGALVRYLKAVVMSAAIDRSRQKNAAATEDDDEKLATMASEEKSQESRLFHARGKEHFGAAFKEALAQLTPQERTLLRMKFVDGLSVEEIGRAFDVHRTTALRWIEKIRQDVLAATRTILREKLKLSEAALDGFMNEVELSLNDRLSRILPALKR